MSRGRDLTRKARNPNSHRAWRWPKRSRSHQRRDDRRGGALPESNSSSRNLAVSLLRMERWLPVVGVGARRGGSGAVAVHRRAAQSAHRNQVPPKRCAAPGQEELAPGIVIGIGMKALILPAAVKTIILCPDGDPEGARRLASGRSLPRSRAPGQDRRHPGDRRPGRRPGARPPGPKRTAMALGPHYGLAAGLRSDAGSRDQRPTGQPEGATARVRGRRRADPYPPQHGAEMVRARSAICTPTRTKWRGVRDNRRKPNGTQYLLVAAAAFGHPVSREWKGFWQRSMG